MASASFTSSGVPNLMALAIVFMKLGSRNEVVVIFELAYFFKTNSDACPIEKNIHT
jgi:hypothetical protein